MTEAHMPDERTALARLLTQPPRLELREQFFPTRAIVLVVLCGDAGGLTPLFARRVVWA